jgi:hypothetical protein
MVSTQFQHPSLQLVVGAALALLSVLIDSESSFAQPAMPQASTISADEASENFNRIITSLVLDSIPHTFTEDKDWGGQDERFDGFERRRDGLRVRFVPRKKLVNDGTWKKYSASLMNPTQEFSVEVDQLRKLPDRRLAFDVNFGAHLAIEGRQSKWVKGVQLYSLSAKGHAKVRLKLEVELEIKPDGNSFPPDLIFVPVVKSADVVLDEFRIDRVGKAGGEFAQQVSRKVQPILERKIEAKEKGLVEKINRKLAKKQDRLRLPVSKVLGSKWGKAAKEFLPK